jgi:hypothetical protein
LRWQVIETVTETDTLQQLSGASRRARIAPQLERHLHVFECVERGNQLKALEHESNFLATQSRAFIFGHRRQVGLVEQDASTRRGIEPGKQAEECRLAAARGPDNRDERALRYRERNIT